MQVADYKQFSGIVHERYLGKRAPVEVSIEVTRRCPLECLHCYNNLPMGDREARKSELTLSEHIRLLDELVAAGCLWVLYTGGEIFGRKDFVEIYKAAKSRGFLVTLFTNGTLITPQIADMLAEWRPFAIEITMYGATRETYEALTQVPGSYDRCMRGIRLLLERNLPLKLKTVPTTVNRHEVFEMKRMAEEDFGVEFKFDPLVNPRIDCSASPLAVRLSPEEVVAIDYHDPKRREEYRRLATHDLSGSPADKRDSDTVYFCGGGMSACAVDPEGRMSICVISHQETYDWRNGSFQEGWDGFLWETRTKKKSRQTRCDDCRIQSLCSMCPANGELEMNDAESPVDFLCQVAHLRAYALDMNVPEHGSCPACAGGEFHSQLRSSAQKIASGQVDVGSWVPVAKLAGPLPILQQSGSGSAGSCGSCGSHAAY
ncbi:MAG TPA: radical SAM protein [Candidatus Acidoferrum sp.]|nr:radical SAM protein [Candidatus Acidoferrum sp.]